MLLIAVKSCQEHKTLGYHRTIMETWGKDAEALDMDVRFFMGVDRLDDLWEEDENEVTLCVNDSYGALPYKTLEILEYSLTLGYENVLLCDTDTFLIPKKILWTKFEEYDYAGVIRRSIGKTFWYDAVDREGNHHEIEHCFPWASGGLGYFLSQKAAEIIVKEEPEGWAEDLWVGQVLGKHNGEGIVIEDLQNFENVVSWHAPRNLDPVGVQNWMRKMYEEHR